MKPKILIALIIANLGYASLWFAQPIVPVLLGLVATITAVMALAEVIVANRIARDLSTSSEEVRRHLKL